METVSETGVLNMIPELSDKQKKRPGRKKRNSKKQENELKNNDSHITSQNGNNADEAFSSGKKKEGATVESTNEDQVQLSQEPGATLHHTDPIFSTREDSLPDANSNGSIQKKTKRKRKKKKGIASCEEKLLDDAEKTTKEDQVHPPNNLLSNIIVQEGSREHAQDSCEKRGAAQLCTVREDSKPDATKMTSSQRRKRKRERDTNVLKGSGVDVQSTSAEVAAKHSTMSEAEGSKSMSNEVKSVASVEINSCVKSKDDTVEQRECTDIKLNETVAQTQSSKAKKRKKRKSKKMKTSNNTELKEDVLEVKHSTISETEGSKSMSLAEKSVASVMVDSSVKSKDECTDVTLNETVVQTQNPKAKKRRKKRKTKTMEVCDSLGNTLTSESQRENSATGEESSFHNLEEIKERETDDNTQVKENVLEGNNNTVPEAEGSKSMIVDEKSVSVVVDISVKSKDDTVEEQECTDVKLNENVAQNQSSKAKKRKKRKTKTVEVCEPLESTFPTSTKSGPIEFVGNNSARPGEKSATGEESGLQNIEKSKEKETDENTEVKEAKEVASSETGDVPRCSCEGQRTRKLVIFDLNGILADIVQGYTGQFVPDGKVSYRSVFRRPFVSSFLDFCFENFEVGIWSSRRIGLDYMVDIVMKNYSRNLLFCFDQNKCTTTKFKTQEKNDKPLFLKDLRRVWECFGTCISCGKRKFDETNTLLVDDSPDKAVCNPPHTGIFPCPYQYTHTQDSLLGPEGELRKYLERLVDAENVQKFVAENPFGQTAITETHQSWEFYSKVVEAHK